MMRASFGQPLSLKQRHIMNWVCAGYCNKEIARRLAMPLPTVKNTLSAIYRKLGVGNRIEALLKYVATVVNDDR